MHFYGSLPSLFPGRGKCLLLQGKRTSLDFVFDREKDITPEEITKKFDTGTPAFLNWFGQYRLFLVPEDDEISEPETKFCYLGQVYDGTKVPIEEHNAFVRHLSPLAPALIHRHRE